MMHDLVSLYDPGSCMRKGCRRENWGPRLSLSLCLTPEPNLSQSYLSPLGYSLDVCSGVVDGRHCSTPFHILTIQLSKANKQPCFSSATCVFCLLICIHFYSQMVKWIKSVCRIERLYYVFLFLKGALEILVGSLQCKHYMQSHTWPLITSKGKETLSQEGVGEMCRVVLIHTSFTYTNGSCLRKEKEGKEVER